MQFFFIISSLILFLYFILIISFFTGWFRIREFEPENINVFPFVSVIIPMRNEEKNLYQLLKNIYSQHYPGERFEVIIVDDHSNDNSVKLIETFTAEYNHHIKLIKLTKDLYGKKKALHSGICTSKGELVLVTDADCELPETWLSTFVSYYLNNDKPKMVSGLVDFKNDHSIFNYIQNLEFLGLIGSGTGAAGIGMPVYCNAASMMFERAVYFEFQDPLGELTVSGDDTFLLHKIKKNYPAKIGFLKSKKAIVFTKPEKNLTGFMHQRRRWSSKARFYRDKDILMVTILISITNFIFLFWMLGAFVFPGRSFVILLLIKLAIDWILMIPILDYFKKNKLHFLVPLLALLMPFYYGTLILMNLFASGFIWKDRKYSNNIRVS